MSTAKPRLLDLFCGAGGAAMGYHRAGFEVVGVDIEPQPDYPFEFVQRDALTQLGMYDIRRFSAVHASPPCQVFTTSSNRWRGQDSAADNHVDLLTPCRRLLEATSLPWVIENVPGAKKAMRNPVELTGGMFGLGVHRPRLFESNVLLLVPTPVSPPEGNIGVYGKLDGRRLQTRSDGSEQRAAATLEEAQVAMGMPWVKEWRGIAEAIPPAYTEFIGTQLLEHLNG